MATRSFFRCCSARQRSDCVCWLSQISADVLKAIERRTAISGLIRARPFRMEMLIGGDQRPEGSEDQRLIMKLTRRDPEGALRAPLFNNFVRIPPS